MSINSLLLSIGISFITTLLATPILKRFLEGIGIVAMDIQKRNKPLMATSGGVPLTAGLLAGLLSYIFITTFITKAGTNITVLFASVSSILMIAIIGFLDDINIQTIKKTDKGEKDIRVGLKQWQKALMPLFAAIPLMVISAGNTTISIPFIGSIQLGIIYPLVIIPLVMGFTSNATNMLAGMNGLETGLGLVLLTSTGLYSLYYGSIEGAILALSMAACLAAFLKYNAYPAKFLPGDSLTYLTGAVFGASVIIGNIEKFALIAFIPWIIEFFLKARMRFKASSLGILQKDGTIKPKYDKTYSLTHVAMRLAKKEERVTQLLVISEAVICVIAFIIARATA